MAKYFYLTTTLPYVNAPPHIGFALELVQADTIVRFQRLLGSEVVFNTGTDEHGQKVYKKALEEKKDPQVYTDEYAPKFEKLKEALNLSYTHFIRTTNPDHKKAAQEFWRRCDKNGDIYKKMYKIKYCVGCELEKTDSELVEGLCPLHPDEKLEIIEEENYFFRFSKYKEKLLKLYDENPEFVFPDYRLREIRNFVSKGLEDFSISRLKRKMPWGVEVPNDPEHVMYVWFDALINYISTLGWPSDQENFSKFWPGVQIAGKDNLRQQSAMWQAMLLSAGLKPSKQIIIHGFITSGGKKMSKSLGNVINPYEIVKKYGTDAVRYYLLREIPPFEDGDYSDSRMQEIYDADLANELGNLVSRLTTLGETEKIIAENQTDKELLKKSLTELAGLMQKYQFNDALNYIWIWIKGLNRKLDNEAPWKKSQLGRQTIIRQLLTDLNAIGNLLSPFLPETAEKIISSTQGQIKKASPLFPKG